MSYLVATARWRFAQPAHRQLLRTPAEQLAAIGAMDDEDRFDHPDFHERYESRGAQYEKERQENAAHRQRPAGLPVDLASRRRR